MDDNRIDLDEAYLRMAEVWSLRSYATRAKVGALIVDPVKKKIISDGYNGMPSGFPNSEVEYFDDDYQVVTNPLVLHAESNAILKCASFDGGTKGCTLYCSFSPCIDCAKLIIQAGIKRVVYRTPYRITTSLPILERAGIEVVHLPEQHEPQNLSAHDKLSRIITTVKNFFGKPMSEKGNHQNSGETTSSSNPLIHGRKRSENE